VSREARQRAILREGEARRNTEPDRPAPQVICAKATGCADALDGDCPFATLGRWINDAYECPATGKPVEWRET
jgi:hypothetical protein